MTGTKPSQAGYDDIAKEWVSTGTHSFRETLAIAPTFIRENPLLPSVLCAVAVRYTVQAITGQQNIAFVVEAIVLLSLLALINRS